MYNSRRSVLLLMAAGMVGMQAGEKGSAAESRFAETQSRSQYVHVIDLYDSKEHRIDPTDPNAPPYSPRFTCGRCHDYVAIAKGHHFNGLLPDAPAGRPGEPWIWVDTDTGTQLPLSYRRWPGTYHPDDLGITPWQFVLHFGRHLPGGGPGEYPLIAAAAAEAEEAADAGESEETAKPESEANEEGSDETGRWRLSGELNVDCMVCHSNRFSYNSELWWEQVQAENFAWAPTVAIGLGVVEGKVAPLPDDFDPAAVDETSREKLPQTKYDPNQITPDQKVFFDIVRRPHNNACYYCHTTREVGEGASPSWNHDQDVHLRAGMTCADCHRNGIEHHTVRGFEGETHPTGEDVTTLSCRGCHMDGEGEEHTLGGRLGAPKPEHRGLPPLHLDKLSCTACHSGPAPAETAQQIQTALAHGLGLPSHDYSAANAPQMVSPVFLQEEGTLYPHRAFWPAFWGKMEGDLVSPLNPETVHDALRRTLRVRRGSTFTETIANVRLSTDDKKSVLGDERVSVPEEEWTDEEKQSMEKLIAQKVAENFQEKVKASLETLKELVEGTEAMPVYVANGLLFRLNGQGEVESVEHEAAKPHVWKLAHDVRPARWSLGAKGCYDCHSDGAPLFESKVAAMGPAPLEEPVTHVMYELAGYDKTKLDTWNQSFQGRTAFKYFGFAAMAVVGLVLLTYLMLGISGLISLGRRR